MIHYYLQKGFTDEYILNLSPQRKLFYLASIALSFDEEREKYNALTGSES